MTGRCFGYISQRLLLLRGDQTTNAIGCTLEHTLNSFDKPAQVYFSSYLPVPLSSWTHSCYGHLHSCFQDFPQFGLTFSQSLAFIWSSRGSFLSDLISWSAVLRPIQGTENRVRSTRIMKLIARHNFICSFQWRWLSAVINSLTQLFSFDYLISYGYYSSNNWMQK